MESLSLGASYNNLEYLHYPERFHGDPKKEPQELEFSEWKKILKMAQTHDEFIEVFERMPYSTDPIEVENFLFGENGIFTEAREKNEQDYEARLFSELSATLDAKLYFKLPKMGSLLKIFLERSIEYVQRKKQALQVVESQESVKEKTSVTALFETKNVQGTQWEQLTREATDGEQKDLMKILIQTGAFNLNKVLQICKNAKLSELIPTMVDALSSLPQGYFRNLFEHFENHPHASAQELLLRIKDKDYSLEDKGTYSRILYLLEMGEVTVTHGQLEYLSKKYNLSGYKKNEAVTAIRITPDGKLGLLDANKKLIGYIEFGDFAGEDEREAQIMEISAELVLAKQNISAFERKKSDKKIEKYLEEYHTIFFEGLIAQETGIHINNISQREQFWFYQFLKENDGTQKKEDVLRYTHEFGESFVQAFVIAEFEKDAGDKILYVAEHLSKEDAKELFEAFSSVALEAQYEVKKIKEECGEDIGLSDGAILEALLVRAKDSLLSVSRRLEHGEKSEEVVRTTTNNLRRETAREKIVSGRFRLLAEVFKDRPIASVDLDEFAAKQEVASERAKNLYLRALSERGELKMIPEIFWKVDRGSDEYRERFGFDINSFLQHIKGKKKKTILEFGPGSGQQRQEREAAGLGKHYNDFALADTLYYPLSRVIEQLLDWEKLESKVGKKLLPAEKQFFTDMLYKMIVVEDDETGKPDFAYAKQRIDRINSDPNALKDILREVSLKLGTTTALPDSYSTVENGKTVYPQQIVVADHLSEPHLKIVQLLLGEQMDEMLKKDMDVYDCIPAQPEGMIIDHFDTIDTLSQQIDVAVAVRSTVYLEGEQYIKFLKNLTERLRSDGVIIDDSIRENFGRRYRVAEFLQVQQEVQQTLVGEKISFQVILGPGIGEDDISQAPMALVISREKNYTAEIQALLQQGYSIVELNEYSEYISHDRALLNRLDATHQLEETLGVSLAA